MKSPVTASVDDRGLWPPKRGAYPARRVPRAERLKLLAVILMPAAAVALVARHTNYVNGPSYWTWSWRHLPALTLYPLMLAAAVPFFVGQWLYARRPDRVRGALALVALSTLLLQVAAMAAQKPAGLRRMVDIVESPN